MRANLPSTQEGRSALPLTARIFTNKKKEGRSVAAKIDYSLVSERWYFFLPVRIGPTDLFMVVPRNDAIFPKLHTNRY